MRFEPVTADQIPQLVPMAREFYAEFDLPGGVVPQVFRANWKMWMENGFGVVIGAFDGDEMVGASGGLVVNAANDGVLEANEMFWYLDPAYREGGHGVKMLQAWEQACREAGAKRISMIRLWGGEGARIGKMLESMGYKPTEVHMYKILEE